MAVAFHQQDLYRDGNTNAAVEPLVTCHDYCEIFKARQDFYCL